MFNKRLVTMISGAILSVSTVLPCAAASANDSSYALDESLKKTSFRVPLTTSHNTVSFPDGKKLSANGWIQTLTWTGCGDFKTSAILNASPTWIRNKTSFYQIGFGGISIKGLSVESSRQGNNTLVWTNNNGAKGSYLSGNVCGGWATVYLGLDVEGTAFYDGSVRIASAHI